MRSRVWKGNFGIKQGFHSGHEAIDIKHRCGTPLYTPENTKALRSRQDQFKAEWLRCSVKGGFLDLVHLKKRVLKEGRKAKKGALIGYSGTTGKSTGCHTHLALWKNGKFVEPTDYLLGDLYTKKKDYAKKEAWHKNRYEALKKRYGLMKKKYITKREAVKTLTKKLKGLDRDAKLGRGVQGILSAIKNRLEAILGLHPRRGNV